MLTRAATAGGAAKCSTTDRQPWTAIVVDAIIDLREIGGLGAQPGDLVSHGMALGQRRYDAGAMAAIADGHDFGRRR